MSFLKNLFVNKKKNNLERLVRRLIFYQDEQIFLDALREATALTPKGEDLGVKALSEAIRRRCCKQDISFYKAPFGKLTVRNKEELLNAEDELLELAKANKLLENPKATQNLISAALSVSQDGLSGLIQNIFLFAGVEQGYDFQLLFNQMHSTIKLRYARGERSWTDKISRNGPPVFR